MRRLFALSVLFLFAAGLRAQAQSLEGIWVTVLDVTGVVYPHVEELRIAPDGSVVTAIYGIRHLPECAEIPPVQTGPCASGQTNITGQLVVDNTNGTIAVNAPALAGAAMSGIGNAADERIARNIFWFGPGQPWEFRREANALVTSRHSRPVVPDTVLDGSKAIIVEKRFHLVDAAFARDLVALAAGGDFSLVKLFCIMPFISGEAASAREFRTLMRDVAAVWQKREELLASMRASSSPGAHALETLTQVMSTLGPANGAPSARDVAATASALGVTVEQVERFVREIATRAPAEPADVLLFSMLRPQEAEIRACHKQYFE
jgi:hypothetical protein